MSKKMILFLALMGSLILAVAYGSVAIGANKTPAKSAPNNVKNSKPKVVVNLGNQKNGCADCHKGKIKLPNGKELDISLAGETKLIPKHPTLPANATVKDCTKCHFSTPEYRVKWVTKLHDVHLNSATFVGQYKQSCSACHNMKYVKGLKG